MALDGAHFEVEYDDHHFNRTTLVSLVPGARMVSVTCSGIVDTSDQAGIIGLHAGHMPLWTFLRPTALTRSGLKVRALVAGVNADRANKLDFLHALSTAVRDAVDYTTGVTDVNTSAEQALAGGQGVCQDQAHVFISAGRLIDVPMRLCQRLSDDERPDRAGCRARPGSKRISMDWAGSVSTYPTASVPMKRYVRVATGRDYREAAPVTGMAVGAGTVTLGVDLSVEQKSLGQSATATATD